MGRPSSLSRATADQMRATAAALAQWEIDAGRTILRSRRRLLVLVMVCLPAFLFVAASSAWPAAVSGSLTDAVPAIGGSKALMPSTVDPGMFLGSILVGLIAGLITGVIGAGGGYILTPALMSFGVRGIMAVGTDQFHLFAKAIMGTTIHSKLGNVNVRLAVWFVVGSFVGVTAGGSVNRAIFQYSPALSDAVISFVYVVVLGFLGFYAVADWRRARRVSGEASHTEATTAFAHKVQRLPLKPRIAFDQDVVPGGRSISIYPVILCGLIVGFVASIMGVGGGFLTFPMFVYGLGVSTFTTVGTDILQIIFTTAYSSIFQYAIYGFVFYSVAVGMLLGSLVGVQIGALVTTKVKGVQIRAFFALTILAGFVNRLCALPSKLDDLGYVSLSVALTDAFETVGTAVFFAIVGVFAVWIIAVFVRDVVPARAVVTAAGGRRRWIAAPRRFALGAGLLAVFLAVLLLMMVPVFDGRNLLAVSDGLFNSRAKSSVDALAKARAQAADWEGTGVDLGVGAGELDDGAAILDVVSRTGEASRTPDGRVRVVGDLGVLAEAAVADAATLFSRDQSALDAAADGGESLTESVYAWWLVFDGLSRRYVQENRADEAAFAKLMAVKVLEPAYNFRGIEATGSGESAPTLAGLLVFYLGYTVLFGFAIMYLFEGLGICADESCAKLER